MFAERALTRGRTVSTVVGPQAAVRTFWDGVGAHVGPPARAALGPAAPGDRRPADVAPDPDVRRTTTRRHGAGSTRRASRCTPRRSASRRRRRWRRALPRPGSASWSPAAGPSPGSTAAGWCSRPRSRAPRRTPRRSRASGCRRTGVARASPCAGMAAVVELVRADIAPVVSLYVNEYNRPPAGPTSGSASGRRTPSPPSCSDAPVTLCAQARDSRQATPSSSPASSPSAAPSTWPSRRSTSR